MLNPDQLTSSQTSQPVLEVFGLSGGPGDQTLFTAFDLHLPAGVSSLLGDEGTGKTSLMRLLSGDLPATSGLIRVGGATKPLPLPQASAVFWIDLRLPHHDALTAVQYWASLRPSLPNWSDEIEHAMVHALQLGPHLHKTLDMLSTGSRRKVGLIASLACGATVTLLDQPFVSLDKPSIRHIQDFLSQARCAPDRAWLIADYESPDDITLACIIDL